MHVMAIALNTKLLYIVVFWHHMERIRSMLMNAVIQQDMAWKKNIINEKILHEVSFKMPSCGLQ